MNEDKTSEYELKTKTDEALEKLKKKIDDTKSIKNIDNFEKKRLTIVWKGIQLTILIFLKKKDKVMRYRYSWILKTSISLIKTKNWLSKK